MCGGLWSRCTSQRASKPRQQKQAKPPPPSSLQKKAMDLRDEEEGEGLTLKAFLRSDMKGLARDLAGAGESVCGATYAVLGNEAGDLDTFVSSVCLAWLLRQEVDPS